MRRAYVRIFLWWRGQGVGGTYFAFSFEMNICQRKWGRCVFFPILTFPSGKLTTLDMRTGNWFGNAKICLFKKIGNFLTRSYGDEFSCYLLDILGLVFYQAAVPLHCCALVLCHFRRYLTIFAPAPPVNPQTISVMLTNIKRACFIMINIKKP